MLWHRRALLALPPLLLAATSLSRSPVSRTAPGDSTAIIMLGTGMPFPDPKAQGPATAVTVGARIFLFDAGPGVERQLTAAGLPVRDGPITALFLTHLHSDHTLGLPDLIFTSWVMGRRRPLPIFGPSGTRAMTDHIIAAWAEDIAIRTDGKERTAPGAYKVDVKEIVGGVVYDSAGVRITAVPVLHGSWKQAFGYRIDAPGKVIVISGDTRPSPALERAAAGADVLIHEVYPAVRLKVEARPGGDSWPGYMRAFHTSDQEIGALAARAKPKLLVLYHIVRMGGTDEELLAGVRSGGFTGKIAIAHDLDRF
ncbi:MAG: MBL fold metallo-hydrolase [Gemmatimonadota bacterium]